MLAGKKVGTTQIKTMAITKEVTAEVQLFLKLVKSVFLCY